MQFDVLTLFPKMFKSPFQESILKKALHKKIITINLYNFRDYSNNKHKKVDDTPYGGGAGMVLTCQPIFDCMGDIKSKKKFTREKTIFLTPQGKIFTQKTAERLAKQDRLILLCGHYEGVDQRVRDTLIDEEISIGKYVLTGGELPAMVLIDTISRLIPGVVGKEASVYEESFSAVLERKKEYPHYTKPADFRGIKMPEVLLNGNHKEIEKWRKEHCK